MKFFELLDELGIKFRLPEHAAVYTVVDGQARKIEV